MAISNDHNWLGRNTFTMNDTLNTLREYAENGESED